MLDSIKADIKKEITKFKKEHKLQNKESIGAFIFMDKTSYGYSMFNGLPTEISTEKLESLKEKAIQNKTYADSEEVYFLKFLSPRKVMFEKLK